MKILFLSPKEPIIRVILGINEDAFTQKGIDTFLNTSYKVGSKSDRMAIYAESSESIEHKNSADIISDLQFLETYKCQKVVFLLF